MAGKEIVKKIEELCAKLVQIYKDWKKEGEKFRSKIEREGGAKPEKEDEYRIEEKTIEEKILRKRSEIYKEIKNQILKDLTLWELDLEGNICPTPGVSVDTTGARGGYILFGYEPGASFIHFFFEEPNVIYKKEITSAFVEEIKQNPQDWKIILEDERDKPLVSEPTVTNLEDHQVVKHKSGRRHNRGYQWYKSKPGFSDEEWAEIENALNNKKSDNFDRNSITLNKEIKKIKTEIEEIKTDKDINNPERQIELRKKEEKLAELERDKANANNTTQKSKSNDFPTGWVVGGGIMLVLGLITILIIKKSKKNK